MHLGLYNYGAKEIFINLKALSSPPKQSRCMGRWAQVPRGLCHAA